jgi:hypothetical protein
MTVEANAAAYPVSRPASAGALFSAALILATVIPFFGIALTPAHPSLVPAVAFVLLLGSTHVVATFYLLTDAEVRRFLRQHPVQMIAIPCLLFAGGMAVLSASGGPVFVAAILAFFLWQTWHFGAQNIGVATFVSLTDRGRPLGRLEKNVIRVGVVVGMLGVLRAMAPTYMIGAQYVPLGPTAVGVLELFYRIGFAVALPVTAVALWLAVGAWLKQQYMFGISMFLSVTFLFTMYVTRDYTLGFISFSAAHGLQYLVFLFVHSFGRGREAVSERRRPFAILAAPAALLLFMLAGRLIWRGPFADDATAVLPTAVAVVLSITLVHFWVDRFIWRMRNKDRADWMRARFGYVLARIPGRAQGVVPS